jgi:hypothetical protein
MTMTILDWSSLGTYHLEMQVDKGGAVGGGRRRRQALDGRTKREGYDIALREGRCKLERGRRYLECVQQSGGFGGHP